MSKILRGFPKKVKTPSHQHSLFSRSSTILLSCNHKKAYFTFLLNHSMFEVVLVHPEIPHNTGAIGRLALANANTLHLVKPLGFQLDEKSVRRAGLDYWNEVDLKVWNSLELFWEHLLNSKKGFHLLTTKSETPYWNASYNAGDFLIFGAETKGLPSSLLNAHPDRAVTIPIDKTAVRSLNLATAVGIVLFEGIRQLKVAPPL